MFDRRFNPIAPTLMRKAINALLGRVFSSSSVSHQKPSKEVVDIIVDSANGDIRSAIMALQFACIVDLPGGARGKGKGKGGKKGARGMYGTSCRYGETRTLNKYLLQLGSYNTKRTVAGPVPPAGKVTL